MIKKNQSRWLIYLLPLLLVVMVLGMLQISAATTRIECENMTLGGQYAGKISSPFSGVALYANNDYCATNFNFTVSPNTISVRGACNNSSTARVDVRVGGTTVGSLYFSGTTASVQSLSNVNTGTGSKEVRLTISTDTGSWDAYVDYVEISNSGSSTPTQSVTPTPTRTGPTPTPGSGSISIAAGRSSALGSFQADQYYSGGSTYQNSRTIDISQITSNPPPAALFNNERYGAMSYTIPGFTAGNSYAVTLYFAETYVTSSGGRIFNVSVNGATALSNFDIYASAGGQDKAIARSFTTTANSSGQIVIQFISGTQSPKINGISITPGSAPPTPTPIRGSSTPTPTRGSSTPTPTQGGITIPPYSSLPTISKLPDPFLLMSGNRITSKSQWATRKAEISALAQAFEYGTKPPVPSNVTGSFSSNRITVNVTENGKSISFQCSITYPSSGTAPYPAIIGVGGSSLNNSAITNLGVAIINFPNDEIAAQSGSSSRGQGKFYTIYGSGHSAGALIAWAWGVDCLITALEKTPAANINPTKLGVTGCSRNGKGALAVGAFCERIALTIPQEPGAGGAASWRISDYSKANGENVQTLSQIVGENCWFTSSFSQFSSTATKLPFDQHSIMGLCAPRPLLVIENTVDWLSPYSAWNSANAAHMIYEGLGIPDYMGFSQYAHTSSHCSFPSQQQAEVTAFIQRFLLGQSANTTCMKNAGYTFEPSRWIDWTVPTLQ